MAVYQLRLPTGWTLAAWIADLHWRVWYALMRHAPLEPLAPRACVRTREILEGLLAARVTTYRSCGQWSYCQAGTTPSPWTPPDAAPPDTPQVSWYILEVREGLEGLVTEATDRVDELIVGLLGRSIPRGVIAAALETALRGGIGRYLYENPHCGVSAFCHGRVPINPWLAPAEAPPPPAGLWLAAREEGS